MAAVSETAVACRTKPNLKSRVEEECDANRLRVPFSYDSRVAAKIDVENRYRIPPIRMWPRRHYAT